MTKRQAELLAFIKAYDAEHGYSPSFDEMKVALGLKSKSGVARIVKSLVEKNEITTVPHRARTIQILSPVERAMRNVAAEQDIDMAVLEQRWDETIERWFG